MPLSTASWSAVNTRSERRLYSARRSPHTHQVTLTKPNPSVSCLASALTTKAKKQLGLLLPLLLPLLRSTALAKSFDILPCISESFLDSCSRNVIEYIRRQRRTGGRRTWRKRDDEYEANRMKGGWIWLYSCDTPPPLPPMPPANHGRGGNV